MIEIVPADIYNPARCDCCGAGGQYMVGMDSFYLCRRCVADAVKVLPDLKEKQGKSMRVNAMTTPADDTRDALPAALERIELLEQVLREHIRTYRVDDQHPDPDAEVYRIMQREVRGWWFRPKTTTENAKSQANAATLASTEAP